MATVGIAEDLKTDNGLEERNDLYIPKLFVYEPEMGLNVFFLSIHIYLYTIGLTCNLYS